MRRRCGSILDLFGVAAGDPGAPAVPADHVPQHAAVVDGSLAQEPGVIALVERADGLEIQARAGANEALAVVAFDVAVLAAGNLLQLFIGQG